MNLSEQLLQLCPERLSEKRIYNLDGTFKDVPDQAPAKPRRGMQTFTVTIEIEGLGGKRKQEYMISARDEQSAILKAYQIIGDQSGTIVSIEGKF